MTSHGQPDGRELDPEAGGTDAVMPDVTKLDETCAYCGTALDEDGDCPNYACAESPYYSAGEDEDELDAEVDED